MTFQPYPTRAGWIALAAGLVLATVAILMLNIVLDPPGPPQFFQAVVAFLVALGLALMAIYWAIAGLTLRYHLNRNGIVIQWGVAQQFIPFEHIIKIVPGHTLSDLPTFRGVNFIGLRFGRGELPGFRLLRFRSTALVGHSLLVITDRASYVISPQQPEAFIKAWQARQSLGPTQDWPEGISRRWPFDTPLFNDALALWLIGLSAALLLVLLGLISLTYSALPAALPIHFDSLGRADRIAPKLFLFTLPVAGAIVWVVNLVFGGILYRREQIGAYLLWGSTIVTMICLWVALFTITGA
ncbi:MAG: hypothetical protein FOGNACKC_02471 [Anaerolineae bacterium]|nr:hypothetical protein [Anaerolineae bacterium]